MWGVHLSSFTCISHPCVFVLALLHFLLSFVHFQIPSPSLALTQHPPYPNAYLLKNKNLEPCSCYGSPRTPSRAREALLTLTGFDIAPCLALMRTYSKIKIWNPAHAMEAPKPPLGPERPSSPSLAFTQHHVLP